jgi:membrane protease YdiL (CAAX protease family)
MKMDRIRVLPPDADLAAELLERFNAVLETLLVFAIFFLISQYFAARGFFERALEMPGSIGTITTHQGWIIATLVGLFLLPVVIRRVTDGWRLTEFGFHRSPAPRDLTLALYLGAVMGLWFALGFWMRPAAFADARDLMAIHHWRDVLFYVGYVALVASALRNEFFFRGYVQRLLSEEYGRPWGTFLSLLFFWLSVSWIGWNHVLMLMVPIGLASALLFNRSGSLYGPLLFHALAFALGFLGYALLELTPTGYAFFTAALALVVLGTLGRMRGLLRGLARDLKYLVLGLESDWLRNGLIAVVLVVGLRVLEWTAHRNLLAHLIFTAILAGIFIAYKISQRVYELRKVLEES